MTYAWTITHNKLKETRIKMCDNPGLERAPEDDAHASDNEAIEFEAPVAGGEAGKSHLGGK